MTSAKPANTQTRLASRLVSGLLNIKPIFSVAKGRARKMMVQRASGIGLDWHEEAQKLRSRDTEAAFAPEWEQTLAEVTDPDLVFPDYYLKPFHAYKQGNLGWGPAMEVEVASQTVHAQIWTGRDSPGDPQGDARLRKSYHDILRAQLPETPQRILDIGCSTGLSSFALQEAFPEAQITGVELSPNFLAIAHYRNQQRVAQGLPNIELHHGLGEATGLPEQSFDHVSICLVCHELPQSATTAMLKEARRLLKPGGHCSFMDMNPQSEVHRKMPPVILTLLKSTEPYIDQYFSLDVTRAFELAGFETPVVTPHTPRHRVVVGRK